MAIAVKCRCGKKFKVKDHMAGKAVRCPTCKGPLRIPAGDADSAAAGKSARGAGKDEGSMALDGDKKAPPPSAEEEAAISEKRNKLIASYDQAAGRRKGKTKTGEITAGKKKKATAFMKFCDGCGVVCSTLIFKYIFIVVMLSGGVLGSIFGVRCASNYVQKESGPSAPKEVRIAVLFEKVEAALEAKQWGKARDALGEILLIEPRKEVHRKYRELKKRLDEESERDGR